jgi:hypothetical protein
MPASPSEAGWRNGDIQISYDYTFGNLKKNYSACELL